MMYITNQVIIFSFLAVAFAILSVATPSKKGTAAPPSKKGPVAPQYICSHGYQLQDDNTCYREIATPPQEVCSPGTLIAPGKCVLDSSPKYQCPDGNISKGKECTAIETAPYLSECPHGSSQCEGSCCTVQTAPVHMVCPLTQSKGTHGGKGSGCVKFEEVQPEPYCPHNYQLTGNSCSGMQMTPCPSKPAPPPPPKKYSPPRKLGKHSKGFQQTNFCSTPVNVPANYKCPAGSIEQRERKHKGGLTCLFPRNVPLQPVCPLAGGTMLPGKSSCQITRTVQPINRCPHGFTDCSRSMMSQHAGGAHCCKQTSLTPTPVCHQGEFSNGRCRQYSPSRLVCYGAGTLVNNSCVQKDTRPALIMAPRKSHKKHH